MKPRSNGNEWSCHHALQRNLFGTCSGQLDPTQGYRADGLAWSRDLLNDVFTKYQQQGFQLGALPGFAGYHLIQETFYQLCKETPGLCRTGLNQTCGTLTGSALLRNPGLVRWCGCYLPDGEYARYTNQYQVNRECTPFCNRSDTIPLTNPEGTQPL